MTRRQRSGDKGAPEQGAYEELEVNQTTTEGHDWHRRQGEPGGHDLN